MEEGLVRITSEWLRNHLRGRGNRLFIVERLSVSG